MIFADTGYYIAMFDRTDQLFPLAAAWSTAIAEPVLVTEYVLIEVVNYFSRRPRRPRAHAAMDAIIAAPDTIVVPASRLLFAAGLDLHRRSIDKDWSLTDCISFALMRSKRLTRALAYDHHFEQAGFEALLRRDP